MSNRYLLVVLFIGLVTGISYANTQDVVKPVFQSSQSDKTNETITLKQALAQAILHNPGLAAFSIEIRAKEAQTIQAGLYPNPKLAVGAEDFGGENGRQEFDGVETTIWLSQLIPLGGKISKKKKVAVLEKNLSVWDYETKKLDVLTFTTKTFIEVLAAQERLHLAYELNVLAQDVLETVSARVKAGKGFPIEKTKAKVALSTSVIKLKRAKRVLEAARRNLALIWGNYNSGFVKVEGDLYITKGIPSFSKLQKKISQNPDMARWKYEIEMRRAVIKRENSNAIPDVTFSFGKRFFAEDNSNAFVMGFSMPLPIFNRNQGSKLEAKHRLSKAVKDEESVKLQILSFLSQSYNGLCIAFMEVETLRDAVIPDAGKVFDSASEWYRKGKFSYLQVLDAQRTLFEIREQYIDALTAYHQGVNNVERLITGKIN
ncbi:MAG: TolC family protein [Candidatus Anammoxibacter sp.]